MNPSPCLGIAVVLALLAVPELRSKAPLLFWNASASVAPGLYGIERAPPRVGDLVLVRLPSRLAALAARRRYLPRAALLIKPVAAAAGDIVCRRGMRVVVRGELAARAHWADAAGRWLPRWHGCQTVRTGELFLLATHPDGFDSRYFGPVPVRSVVGRAILIWPRVAAK
jgi:conjugative transfer signal peptidase TraF